MSVENDRPWLKKVPDPSLRGFIAEDATNKMSVIVELDLPQQKLSFVEKQTGTGTPKRITRRVDSETPKEQRDTERTIRTASSFLKSLLGSKPHHLKAARAFVVTATPEQLRKIAQLPAIKMIRVNRTLR